MKQSKTKLQSVPKWIYFCFLLTLFQFIMRYFVFPKTSVYSGGETDFYGIVTEVRTFDYGIKITFQEKEILSGYIKKDTVKSVPKVREVIHVSGTLKEIKKETIPNLFSYQTYLRSKGQFYEVEIETIEVIGKKNPGFFQLLESQIEKLNLSKPYLKALLLQEKEDIKSEVLSSFQTNGIMHLFAISGLHISLLIGKFRSRWGKICITCLLFFPFSSNVSFLRAGVFTLLQQLSKNKHWYSSTICSMLSCLILLWINPYYVDQSAFWYTVVISLFLQITKTKRKKLYAPHITTCFLIWIVSLPIQLFCFFELNFLSPLWNCLLTPIFVYLLLPLFLLTLLFPFFDFLTYCFIAIFEQLSLFLANYAHLNLVVGHPNEIQMMLLIFLVILFLIHFFHAKKWLFLDTGLIILLFLIPKPNEITFLDVSQADATFFASNGYYALLDTSKDKGEKLVSFLKSKGVTKLDYLFLTHGDIDHIGGSIPILNQIEVKEVVFNLGTMKEIEKKIFDLATKKSKVSFCEEKNTYQVGAFTFYSLNQERKEENDSSCVFLVTEGFSHLLFLGDIPEKIEDDIVKHFSLPTIDYLHLSHHGSKTSTGENLLQEINPSYAIISSGKNNRYHHPSKETIEKLEKRNIPYLLTSEVGSIEIKLKRGRAWIKTYHP